MYKAKDIILRPIPSREARAFIRANHYSGSVANNSNLHVGVFLGGKLEGAMQLGPPLDKSKLLGLVEGTRWENMAELNRMAFTDVLPPNSESRALGVLARVLRTHAPQLKWIVSFADATQCGDGTIYRAAGFDLTMIKESNNLARFPNGQVIHKITFQSSPTSPREMLGGRSFYDVTGGRHDWGKFLRETGGVIVPGHQIRYVKFIDPSWSDRLTCERLPYSEIDRVGAGMYRGERR